MLKLALIALLGILSILALADDFTLENDFVKQQKLYPFITPYDADSVDCISYIDVEYNQIGERKLTADIFLPIDTIGKKFDLIILIHGGGWCTGSKLMDHPMARSLADRGYATMCIDYRKSTEALYPAAIIDIKCAIRWARSVANKYHFHDSRLTLLGTSAGGQLAALIGSENGSVDKYHSVLYSEFSDRVERVVDIDGILAFIHPQSKEGQDKPNKLSSATLWFGCSADTCQYLYIEASALSHVGSQSADFFFINSSRPRFSAGQVEMIDSLRQYEKNVESVQIALDVPHTFWLYNPWASIAIDLIDNWLKKTQDNKKEM